MPKELLVLYLCLYLSMIGYGISLPVVPFFIQDLAQSPDAGSAVITFHVGAITAIFAFMQMISAPVWGRMSDKTGRRKTTLLLGLSGYAVSLALTGFSIDVTTLYLARMLNGLFSAAVLPIASAYIVDAIPEEHRTKGLAWHGTVVGLGVVSGPAIGVVFSEFAKNHPFHLGFLSINAFSSVFFLASLLSIFSVILAGTMLPASHSAEKGNDRAQVDLTPLPKQKGVLRGPILVTLLLALFSQLALSLFEGTFVLHAQNTIEITTTQMGYVFMVCGLAMALPQGTAIAGYIEKFGPAKLLPIGLTIMAGGLILLMFGRSISSILWFVAILALGMAIVIPSITVIISEHADGEMGKSLGLLTGANSIGQTLGPLAGSLLFMLNIHLPYLLAAMLLLLAAVYVNVNVTYMSKKTITKLI